MREGCSGKKFRDVVKSETVQTLLVIRLSVLFGAENIFVVRSSVLFGLENPQGCETPWATDSDHWRGLDQFGDSLVPCVVNWRCWVPSASMDQICQVPVRVDAKTM